MKKVLSVVLCIALACGILASFGAITVGAENDYSAELWSPVEISLISTVTYKYPYKEAEIDAVFTHEDGTEIKTPGFCKDGNNGWAVRFSPTKTGKWTFKVTCSDASNAGLNISGTVTATESTKTTEIAKRGFVKISDSGRYYTYNDGTPFLWIGDTNWQAPNYVDATKCNYPGCNCGSQILHEVKDRVSKGFTVYQTYFSSTGTQLWKAQYKKPNFDRFNNEIDKIFQTVNDYGLVIALGFGLHNGTPGSMKDEDLLAFTRYCIARYSCYNIVWITGQEITNTNPSATKDKTCMDVWMEVGELTGKLDGYKHPNGAHMYPMKSTDDRAVRLDQSDWHQAWILQGGHGGVAKAKNFYESYYTTASGKVKPYLEGENNYEDINCGGYTGYNANRWNAWKSMLCGCCGFTYGASGVWIDAKDNKSNVCYGEDNSYSYDPWYIGLEKQGSFEIKYMAEFLSNIDWEKLVPRFYDAEYLDFNGEENKVMASTEDGKTAVFYFYNNDKITGTAKKLAQGTFKAYWFDVLNGKYIALDDIKPDAEGNVILPEKPDNQDWVLLLTQNDFKHDYYKGKYFADLGQGAIEGTLTKPVSVHAIGGITYKGRSVVDNTANLYDGNEATTWTPNAERVAQIIIYDLGEAKDLTHVVITPAKDTVLRQLRVYASNDGEVWDMIVNNVERENFMDGTSISEKLAGGYRYVKIFLLPAPTLHKADTEGISYRLHMNKQSSKDGDYYPELEIAEIAVYTNGTSANPVTQELVKIAKDDTDITDIDISNNTDNKGDVQENENKDNGDTAKKSDSTLIIVVACIGGAIVIAAAVFIIITLRKDKKKE